MSKRQPAWHRTVRGRRTLRGALVIAGAALAGYLMTVFWLYPAPGFHSGERVARVIGLSSREATELLTQQRFRAKILREEQHPAIPAGDIIWQDPPAGLILPEGASVQLTVSAGPTPVTIPDLTGIDLRQAQRILAAAGFRPGSVDSVPSQADPGTVIGSRPVDGTARLPGSSVDLTVSQGPARPPRADLKARIRS